MTGQAPFPIPCICPNERFEVIAAAGRQMLEGLRLKAVRRDICTTARDEALRHLKQTDLPMIHAQDWEPRIRVGPSTWA